MAFILVVHTCRVSPCVPKTNQASYTLYSYMQLWEVGLYMIMDCVEQIVGNTCNITIAQVSGKITGKKFITASKENIQQM